MFIKVQNTSNIYFDGIYKPQTFDTLLCILDFKLLKKHYLFLGSVHILQKTFAFNMLQPNGLPKEIPCIFSIDLRVTVKDEFRFEIES